jgi:hypothetical protein
MIRMIATTINSSISEKPREFFLINLPPQENTLGPLVNLARPLKAR